MINVARDHSFAFVEIAQSAHIKVSLGMWDCQAELTNTSLQSYSCLILHLKRNHWKFGSVICQSYISEATCLVLRFFSVTAKSRTNYSDNLIF
jgi:hypothetical protein